MVSVVDGSRFLMELDSLESLRQRDWQADPEDERTIAHLLCDQVEFGKSMCVVCCLLIINSLSYVTSSTDHTKANVIVLNKCDLMTEEEKQEVKLLISLMNATAKIVESTYSVVPLSMVLGTGMFSLNDAEKNDRWLKEARIGDHTPETIEYGITSFTYRALKPFYPKKLDDTIMAMLDKETPFDKSIILRAKGYMWLASYPDLQGDFSLVSLFRCVYHVCA